MKNCVLYLVRTSEKDIEDLILSLDFLYSNLLCLTEADVILFHENDFEKYKDRIKYPVLFQEVSFKIPDYPKNIMDNIPEFYPHPTHGNGPIAWGHPGFSLGYRHMCRFFSGEMYTYDIIKQYDYYLRLDTDSLIHTPLNYDIFQWAENNQCHYGYIEPAVQFDNPKVIEGLWDLFDTDIPEGKMYYTNFELGKVSFFLDKEYQSFYHKIDKGGGIYTKRWGDAPIKYLGVNMFMNPKHIQPVRGFVYQHGAVYST
jgi:alpha 1,2-mannosyltransferase